MSKKEKLIQKFKKAEKSFKFSELESLLKSLGFKKYEREGSRVDFDNGETMIKIHRPHPGNEVKPYAL